MPGTRAVIRMLAVSRRCWGSPRCLPGLAVSAEVPVGGPVGGIPGWLRGYMTGETAVTSAAIAASANSRVIWIDVDGRVVKYAESV